MKKIIAIAFAAIIAGLAISCQKEEAVSDKADAVQYTFNITVNDRVGFDSEVSTKGATAPTYKSEWGNGDKIFLFFKPTSGNLLTDTYATLTYNGSSWDGAKTGTTSLGNGGTLSAVYVYKLDGSITPAYTDSKWTIATGNTFYNCQTGVSYTVSGDVISASLDLEAPADFVCFSIYGTSGDALTCDKVKGWKDVVIGSEMTFSNATCTGYMTGFDNIDNSSYKDYYGRIVGGGTSLNGLTCNFSVVKNGQVWERTATPSSDKRSFYMDVRTDGDKPWTVAEGKLPGLFTISKGADGIAGTADDVQVRFSQGNLVATINATGTPTAWKFATNQYDYLGEGGANKTIGTTAGDVDLFGWSTDATSNNWGIHTKSSATEGFTTGNFKDWGATIDDKGTWRTLSIDEWTYLFNNHSKKWATVNEVGGYVIAPDDFAGTLADTYADDAALAANNLVFLPAAGHRLGSSYVFSAGSGGYYWASTVHGSSEAYDVNFDSSQLYLNAYGSRHNGYSVRLITDASAAPAPTPTTTGTAKRTGDIDVNWVQLWENGPKFAEYNVGVTDGKAESYGEYYAWGGNQNVEGVVSPTYKGGTDPLTGADDTATNLWGSNWRMPTQAELEALLSSCDVEWMNGSTKKYNNTTVEGLLCKGKGAYASNSVFLPAAGYCYDGSVNDQGDGGYYWSSTPKGSDRAYGLIFVSLFQSVGSDSRDRGFSVRAVLAE